ncbi:MAG: hypothetical protein WBC44_01300 [Planctomycetaceae bacterium]
MPGHSPSLPPRQPRRTSAAPAAPTTSRRRSPARNKKSGPPVGLLIGGAVAAFFLIAGGVVVYQKFVSPHVRVSASDIGLDGVVGDSPKAILGDFVDVIDDLETMAASITDAESAQAALPKIVDLENRLVEIQRRVVLVEPVSRDEMKAIENSMGKPKSAEGFKGQAERLKDAGLIEGEFAAAMRSLGFRMQSTIGVMKDGMTTLPEPRNEFETLARDYIALEREQTRIIARVETADDVPAAVKELEALVPKMDALTERKQAFGRARQSAVTLAHNDYVFYGTSGAERDLTIALTAKLGPIADLNSALVNVSTAESKFNFALMAGASDHAANPHENLQSGPLPPGGGIQAGPAGAMAQGGPGRRGGTRLQPPVLAATDKVTIILEGGPFASAGHLNGEEFFAAKKRQNEAQAEYGPRLKALAESNPRNSTITGGTSQNIFAYTGDVQELADTIDFGTVVEVNTESRTIVVDMPEE